MNNCKGILGKLVGHKFKARADTKYGASKWPFTEGTIESQISTSESVVDILRETGTCDETYVCDICTRCGMVIKRDKVRK